MCMPYLGKLFGGGQRRRNRSSTTPRPSLAPTPQQSNATIQTANNANLSVARRDSIDPVNLSYATGAGRTGTASVQGTTGGSVRSNQTAASGQQQQQQQQQGNANAPAPSGGTGTGQRPTSWWDYFGMNRNKKGSIDSL
ncbi:hypothetical protein KR222_010553 [Zaprionus bogoriensis]|nr:hypothetical protein KR222_010553 [Zaprionus bogoriensis]